MGFTHDEHEPCTGSSKFAQFLSGQKEKPKTSGNGQQRKNESPLFGKTLTQIGKPWRACWSVFGQEQAGPINVVEGNILDVVAGDRTTAVFNRNMMNAILSCWCLQIPSACCQEAHVGGTVLVHSQKKNKGNSETCQK